jgi:hypothetical protein
MDVARVLHELIAAGVTLTADGDQLRIVASPGVLTPKRLGLLRQHKPALLGLLSGPDGRPPKRLERDAVGDPIDAEARLRNEIAAMSSLARCSVCGHERNAEIISCPWCYPAASLPLECLAPAACTALGPCIRKVLDTGCRVASAEPGKGRLLRAH